MERTASTLNAKEQTAPASAAIAEIGKVSFCSGKLMTKIFLKLMRKYFLIKICSLKGESGSRWRKKDNYKLQKCSMSQILTICWFKLAKLLLIQLHWIILGPTSILLHQIKARVLFDKLLLFVCSFLEVLFPSGKDLQITAGVNHSFPKRSHLTRVQVSPTKLGRAKLNFKFLLTEIKSSSILCIYFSVVERCGQIDGELDDSALHGSPVSTRYLCWCCCNHEYSPEPFIVALWSLP